MTEHTVASQEQKRKRPRLLLPSVSPRDECASALPAQWHLGASLFFVSHFPVLLRSAGFCCALSPPFVDTVKRETPQNKTKKQLSFSLSPNGTPPELCHTFAVLPLPLSICAERTSFSLLPLHSSTCLQRTCSLRILFFFCFRNQR